MSVMSNSLAHRRADRIIADIADIADHARSHLETAATPGFGAVSSPTPRDVPPGGGLASQTCSWADVNERQKKGTQKPVADDRNWVFVTVPAQRKLAD